MAVSPIVRTTPRATHVRDWSPVSPDRYEQAQEAERRYSTGKGSANLTLRARTLDALEERIFDDFAPLTEAVLVDRAKRSVPRDDFTDGLLGWVCRLHKKSSSSARPRVAAASPAFAAADAR